MKSMKTVRSDVATGAKATTPADVPPKSAVGARRAGAEPLATQGKRTAVGARARVPARHGATSAATQGPARLQGRAGPARAVTRGRSKKG